ncbi:YgaP family membrane protein [Phenylobacterium sp.]|uniref:YgaP family membrane protein n=1 Tax=Phenylobacterium sp. TaxID=1871053 RepID=UPI002FE1598F
MTIERAVLLFAGLMILASLALTYFVSPWWMLLTAFVGLNLIQSSFTGFCPAAMVFRKLGLSSGTAFRVGPAPVVADPTVTPLRP